MTPADIATITRVMGPVVREFTAKSVSEALAPLLERNAALELRILELETHPAPVVIGPIGQSGQKGDAGAGIASLVVSAEGRLLAHLTDGRSLDAGPVPSGHKGDTGERGEAGLIGPPGPSGPVGERGEKGEAGLGLTGAQGERGLPGAQGERGQDAPGPDVDAIVTRVLALVPPPVRGEKGEKGDTGANGRDGQDGALGERGLSGEKGLDGLAGRDGRDGAPGAPGAMGEKGLDGAPGAAGRDGLNGKDGTLEQLKVVYDGERTVQFCFKDGTPIDGGVLTFPSQIDRGVYQAGKTYDVGDGATWDGHFWIAQEKTSEAPGEGCPSWRLAVRRGKQGREGKQGKDGSAGRDLTQMDPATGRKW